MTPGDNKYRVTGSVEAAGLDLKRSTWTPRYFEGYGVVEGEQRGSLQGRSGAPCMRRADVP